MSREVKESLKGISDKKYELFKVSTGIKSDEKSSALLAFDKDGTSLCLVTILHFNDISAKKLYDTRKELNSAIEEFLFKHKKRPNHSIDKVFDLNGSVYHAFRGVIRDRYSIKSMNIFADYVFTFFIVPNDGTLFNKLCDMVEKDLVGKSQNDRQEDAQENITEDAIKGWLRCYWPTLVVAQKTHRRKSTQPLMIAMQILMQSLWNSNQKLSKLVAATSSTGSDYLTESKKRRLGIRKIDLRIHDLPKNIDGLVNSGISEENIQILKAIEQGSLLKSRVENLAQAVEATLESTRQRSGTTFQWFLALVGVFTIIGTYFSIMPRFLESLEFLFKASFIIALFAVLIFSIYVMLTSYRNLRLYSKRQRYRIWQRLRIKWLNRCAHRSMC